MASDLNSCCQAVPICLEFLFVLLKFLNMPNKIYFPRLKQEHKMMLMNQKFSFLFKFWRGAVVEVNNISFLEMLIKDFLDVLLERKPLLSQETLYFQHL